MTVEDNGVVDIVSDLLKVSTSKGISFYQHQHFQFSSNCNTA